MFSQNIEKGYQVAFNAALGHKNDIKNKKSSHLGCAVFVDNKLVVVTDNNKDNHAEMSALFLLNGSFDYCREKQCTQD